MTSQERIAAIENLGYTGRQAAFLCLAALHSGYFLRRQCNTFFGSERGGAAGRLITKATERGHVSVHPSADKTLIYHVCNQVFYKLMGEQDNTNRRWRQSHSVKIKLMGFDYILCHPDQIYFATEQEKTNYFCRQLNLPVEILPACTYRSRTQQMPTTRYFVDKFPIFLSSTHDAPSPAVGFCYIDGSTGKPSGFDTYLLQYRALWKKLERVHVVYVSADRHMFPKARGNFTKIVGVKSAALGKENRLRMLNHFRQRALLERRETSTLDKNALDRLREELEEFSGAECAELYWQWRRNGDGVVDDKNGNAFEDKCSFSTFELWHDYKLFGNLAKFMA